MAIDFPNSPTLNQTYAVGTKTWKYDGEKWVIVNNSTAGASSQDILNLHTRLAMETT